MAEHTTISVSKNLKRDMDERRGEDESWNDYLKRMHGQDSAATVTVEAEDMRPVIREELLDAMSEASINVTIDGESDMNEEDVRTMIQTEIDALKEELRR